MSWAVVIALALATGLAAVLLFRVPRPQWALLGVALALGLGVLIGKLGGGSFTMVYSTSSIVAAFLCSTLIGVVFGFLPARSAAQLDPVEALARE